MLLWTIQITLLSIILIFLVQYLINFFKSTLTVPKIKDLVNNPTHKYENMFNVISSHHEQNPSPSPNTATATRVRGVRFADLGAREQRPIQMAFLAADPRGILRRLEEADDGAEDGAEHKASRCAVN